MEHEIFYKGLQKKVKEYISAIGKLGFAEKEYNSLNHDPQTLEELLEVVSSIIDTGKELNQIMEQSPSSIFVTDADGKTLKINKTFEELTDINRKTLLYRTTADIEADNIFDPSVCILALEEGRKVIAHQSVNGVKDFISTGVPILNEHGEIFRVVTNALLSDSISNISNYLKCKKTGGSMIDKGRIIAASPEMKRVLHLADLIKDTESTIIIEGETGTGKSMLARYIHNSSNRSDKNIKEINCGAIPDALLESELFGYCSGAFTGASKKGKPGLIELCEGGSIFLDEISELPLFLQVKLLHFLQEKKLTRVGGTEEISVNVRVIVATNKSLKTLVEKGEFREDLYYRLNVVPITIPPLRERKEDILPAVEYFIEKYTKLYNKALTFDQDFRDRFLEEPWEGNMRELENCIERMVVTEGVIPFVSSNRQSENFQSEREQKSKEETNHLIAAPKHNPCRSPKQTLKDMERDMIINAWEKYHSSYKVAEELGISQSNANRKIRKYITNREESW